MHMAVPLVVVGIATAASVIIIIISAATAFLYFNPAEITNMLGGQEGERQDLILADETWSRSNNKTYRQVNVTVNGIVLAADIAATNEQRARGLSVKDSLAENEAMLFVFDSKAEHVFWMKDMKFPIDIIWIDNNKTVVHIEHDLEPCSSQVLCPTYKPNDDSLYVLETVGGFAVAHDIVEGTHVDFELKP
jgi:uncharacterized membrane protein (UPF0127 family)